MKSFTFNLQGSPVLEDQARYRLLQRHLTGQVPIDMKNKKNKATPLLTTKVTLSFYIKCTYVNDRLVGVDIDSITSPLVHGILLMNLRCRAYEAATFNLSG